ncbi:SurA N-terminal domain-containing protein [Eilatimonas milleporae]|uniref:Parvulin-like PPIase n=1 Tax=Eilatimonas milleporae TaxID=911205 RepID=A0A3M0CGP9_9PROT|nr:SurA N-terminal domain-containing protein [Eilatimonas milleporae]RMB08794.1 peptidyl-prolyl cis-trans isomerase D [Eilatimonas milleporae]
MLTKLRGGLDSIFVTVLLGILIAAFAIWGIGPGFLSGTNTAVAVVGDEEIPPQRFASMVQTRARTLQQQFGNEMPADQLIRMLNLDYQVLNEMIAEAALMEYAGRLGLRATDDQVAEQLRSIDAFLLPDGSFSAEMMRQTLQSAGLSQQDLFADLRNAVRREQLLGSMTASTPLPRTLARRLYVWQEERRRATLINIGNDAVETVDAPDEDTLTAYYDANKSAYLSPERRSYTYILLTPDVFMDEVTVDEEDLDAAYTDRLETYVQPELRSVEQVTLASMAEADALLASVAAGTDFLDAAEAASDFTRAELDLGDLTRDDIDTDFGAEAADTVFALAEGAVSEPVEGPAGWNLFRVTSITPGATRTLDDVRDELEPVARRNKAIDLMFDYMPEVEDAIAGEATLAEAAARLERVTLASATLVDRRGRNAAEERVIAQSDEFRILAAAFQAEVGDIPDLMDLDASNANRGAFWVELSEIAEPAEQPLDTVRTRVVTAWTDAEKLKKAGALAEQALDRLRGGEAAEEIAVDIGGTSFEAKNVNRTGGDSASLASNIRSLIFDLAQGQADLEQASDASGYVIVRVDDIQPGDPDRDTDAVERLYGQLSDQVGQEMLIQYQGQLLKTYPPSINEALVRQLFRNDDE